MKRWLAFALAVLLLCGLPFGAACAAGEAPQPTDDGGRIETELISGYVPSEPGGVGTDEDYHGESAQSRTTTKTLLRRYYDADGHLDWMVALTATFRYTGLGATCTEVRKTCRIYDGAWRLTASNATKSGNHAAASFTLSCTVTGVAVKTVDVTLDLYCDRSGTVSTEPQSAGLTLSFLSQWLNAVQTLLRCLFQL